MYVCVCLAVSQSEVEKAIENGANTREAVTRACGAGGDCGACHGMIETMIENMEDTVTDTAVDRLIPDAALVRTRAA